MKIDCWVEGLIGRIRLRRPDKLNAFDGEMIDAMASALERWESDPNVAAILVEGEGKAFCAGGDIRSLSALAEHEGVGAAVEVFRCEYRLVSKIAHYPKPYIAIIDGITMGSGVGLSVHGTAQIATERTVFAMPETAIGFFPDVGTTYFLPRLPTTGLGHWLGLTGTALRGEDVRRADLATHYVKSAHLNTLVGRLVAASTHEEIAVTLRGARLPSPESSDWAALTVRVSAHFAKPDLASIMVGLLQPAAVHRNWAEAQLEKLESVSPTGLTLAFGLMQAGSDHVDAALEREFTAVQHLLAGSEFYEGVRAMVIDKDKRPRWAPASLAEIDDGLVEAFLTPGAFGNLGLAPR